MRRTTILVFLPCALARCWLQLLPPSRLALPGVQAREAGGANLLALAAVDCPRRAVAEPPFCCARVALSA